MIRYFATALISGLLLAAAPAPDDDKKDAEKLQGTWKAISAESSGLPWKDADAKPIFITFDKDTFAIKEGKTAFLKGTFKLDSSTKPKTINLTATEGEEKGKELHGIYEVDKDGLKLCVTEASEKDRPREFATKEGVKHELFTFKKEKP